VAAASSSKQESESGSDLKKRLVHRAHFNMQSTDDTLRSSKQMSTDDCSSAGGSEMFSGPYEVIEYDAADDGDFNSDFFNELDLRIEENSAAADALRANANVRVSLAGKAARAVNMQVMRKLVKRATGTSKSGNVRGKPPRIPFSQAPGSEAEGAASIIPRRRASTDFSLPVVKEEKEAVSKSMPPLSMPQIEDDEAHIEDDVVAGTREASKQGKVE
jgi:hypothetical protein